MLGFVRVARQLYMGKQPKCLSGNETAIHLGQSPLHSTCGVCVLSNSI